MPGIERYSFVWQKCGKNSRYAERFYVPGYDGYLPFFVWGRKDRSANKLVKLITGSRVLRA